MLLRPEFCSSLTMKKERAIESPLAFAVKKNSPWKSRISREIRILKDEGFVNAVTEKWFYKPECSLSSTQAHEFPWQYIGGMITAVGCVALLSVMVVCWETFHTKRKRFVSSEKSLTCMPGYVNHFDLESYEASKLNNSHVY